MPDLDVPEATHIAIETGLFQAMANYIGSRPSAETGALYEALRTTPRFPAAIVPPAQVEPAEQDTVAGGARPDAV
jgi:hypothetical protein